MDEPEKEKRSPFAEYLHADEEIVWQYVYKVPVRKEDKNLQSTFTFLFVGYIAVLTLVALVNQAAVIPCGGLFLFLLVAFVRLYPSQRKSKPELLIQGAYAITDQRLLYRYGEEFKELALEDVSSIEVASLPEHKDYQLLSFGRSFPLWGVFPNADEIKLLIQKVRLRRMKKRE